MQSRTQMFQKTQRQLPKQLKPQNFLKASVYKSVNTITITGQAQFCKYRMDDPKWDRQLQTLDRHWMIQNRTEGNPTSLIESICHHMAVAVSDSLYLNPAVAAAWTIEGETKDNRILGEGGTPGSTEDQSAYCSELFGFWCILYTLLELSNKYQIKARQVQDLQGLRQRRKAPWRLLEDSCLPCLWCEAWWTTQEQTCCWWASYWSPTW